MGQGSIATKRVDDPHGMFEARSGRPIRWGIWGTIAACIMGLSILIHPSPISPLVVLAAGGGVGVIIYFFRQPVYALYAALFMTLLPVGFIPEDIHSLLNRSLTVLALVTWGASLIRQKAGFNWTKEAGMMFLFLLWAAATLTRASNLEEGVNGLLVYTVRFALFFVLVLNEIRTPRDLGRLMGTLAITGWIVLAVSGLTLMGEGYVSGTRLKIMRINENELGISALVSLPGVLWFTMQSSARNKTLWKLLGLIFLSLTMALMAMTGSRGGAVSLVVTLLCFWIWKPTRVWGKFGLIVLFITMLFFPSLFITTLGRFSGESGETLLGGREALWGEAWKVIRENPLAGVGIGNSPFVLRTNLLAWEEDIMPIHNPVLTVWSETGTLGVILYLGVLVSAAWAFVRQFKSHQRSPRDWLTPYYPLVASTFLGYFMSWIKGGGAESGFSFFLLISLLLIPSCLEKPGPAAINNPMPKWGTKRGGKEKT